MSYQDTIIDVAQYHHEDPHDFISLWTYIDNGEQFKPFGDTADFEFVKQVFFDVIGYAMQQGWLRLAKNGVFLTGSIDEQIQLFKDKFPKSKMDTLEKDPIHFDIWFFADSCPAGAVWVYQLEDDSEYLEWT
ncbi:MULTISPECIES: DUF596 domain-containing protein [unclassified Acinetobacter]